jgi:curved DNA-binding protein CbpA
MDGRRARHVLGVAPDAGPDEVRRAFRAEALRTHPDHGGSPEAFAETMAAFAVLRTAPRRRSIIRRRVDVYDSPRAPAPARRPFADFLNTALGRL